MLGDFSEEMLCAVLGLLERMGQILSVHGEPGAARLTTRNVHPSAFVDGWLNLLM